MVSLLIRTDFSDDRAWEEVCRAVQEPQTPDEFQASVECISDEACAGLAPEAVAALLPPGSRRPFVFLADARACQTPGHPVLVVDLLDEPGRTFRVVAAHAWAIENNLRLANMDFAEFASAAGKDGVFRGLHR